MNRSDRCHGSEATFAVVPRILVLIASALAAIVILSGTSDAKGASGDLCSDRFPETEWTVLSGSGISVEATGVPPGLAQRYFEEIEIASEWISEEIGSFAATVCLIDLSSDFDESRFSTESRRFHARMEMDEQLLLLNVERIGLVGPAASWALAHHALWQNGAQGGNPEPISSVIGQWYRARILNRLELYHRDVMVDNFFDTEAVIDWTVDRQPPALDWDPENNFQAIGDFVDFAVGAYGNEVLLETSGQRWSEIEGEWRQALRADLTGRTTPTTEWIVGIALAILVIVGGASAAALGIWSKRRRRRRPETSEPIPGFFTKS